MQPEQPIASGNLLQVYIGLNRMTDARTGMEQARKLGIDTSTFFVWSSCRLTLCWASQMKCRGS